MVVSDVRLATIEMIGARLAIGKAGHGLADGGVRIVP